MIVVTGATGAIGSRVVRALAEAQVDVTAAVRSESRARELLPPGTTARIANYEDLDQLRAAFAGAAAVLYIPSDGFAKDLIIHQRNALDAAMQAGVGHFVLLSIMDVAPDSPFYYAPVYRDAESRLVGSGMNWTVLRCGLYANFLAASILQPAKKSGALSVPAGQSVVSPISRADIAKACANVLKSPETHREKVYTLTGPESLTFGELAAVEGLTYQDSSPTDYLLNLLQTLEDPWPFAFSTLFAAIREGRFARVSEDYRALTREQPQSFADFSATAFQH